MQTFNIQDAKARLSKLVDRAAQGEPFIIAKAGKPLVKVVPLTDRDRREIKRRRFMAGQLAVPDDFDRMSGAAINRLLTARTTFNGGK